MYIYNLREKNRFYASNKMYSFPLWKKKKRKNVNSYVITTKVIFRFYFVLVDFIINTLGIVVHFLHVSYMII